MAAGQGFRRRPKHSVSGRAYRDPKRPDRLDAEQINTTRAMIQRIDLPREARVRIGVPHEMPVADVVAALREMASYLRRVEQENAA